LFLAYSLSVPSTRLTKPPTSTTPSALHRTAEATDLKTVFIASIDLQDILDRLDEGGIAPSGIKELLGWISSSFQDSISTARRRHHPPSTQDDPSSLILSAKTKDGVNIDLCIAPIETDNGQNIALVKWVTDDILSCLFGERDRLQMDLHVCREEFSNRERKMSDVLELLDRLKSGERVATHSEGEGPNEKKDDKEEEVNGGGGGVGGSKKRGYGEGDAEGQRNKDGGTRGRGSRGPVRGSMRALRGSRALRGRLAGGSLTKLGR